MAIRSENDPRYYRRFWIMGIVALGYMLLCLKDGILDYPSQRERALAWRSLARKAALMNGTSWPESADGPKVPADLASRRHTKAKSLMQFVMAAGSGLIGLWLISLPLRARGRWIEATDTGLTSSWGQSLDFDKIVRLDKFRWRSKGIAKITYQDNGRKRRFVLDNYKFDRHTTDAILYELEQRIDPALITGGPPEPPPEEHPEEEYPEVAELSKHRFRTGAKRQSNCAVGSPAAAHRVCLLQSRLLPRFLDDAPFRIVG